MSEHDQDPTAPEAAQPQQPEVGETQQPQPAAPEQPVDERQWIPVPPPHPYAAAAAPRGGRLLAILAMALGLVSLLSVGVGARFLSPLYVYVGIVLAVAAIVLGIVALVKRSRPKAAAITGLVAGGLSVVVSVVFAIVMSVLLVATTVDMQRAEERDPGQSSDSEPQTLLEWPANMATGGIVFEQGDQGPGPAVRPSDPLSAGEAPTPIEVDRAGGTPDVVVYLDYRCPYCLHFEEANGDFLGELASSGGATVQVVPLTFLDRVDASSYSSRAAGAMACIVDGQPESAWAAHTTLLSAAVQPSESVPGHANEELIAALDPAVGGLDGGVRDCIESERFVPFSQALNSWVFANTVPNAADPAQQVTGTPLVLVNGVAYTGQPSDPAAFRQFFDEQTR